MIKQKKYKASVTVEMSYVMPLILFIIISLIHISFYFHDKIIVSGAVGETLVTGTQYAGEKGREAIDLKAFLKNRIENKLLALKTKDMEVFIGKNQIEVQVKAGKGGMHLFVHQKALMVRPEEILRKKRKWEILSQGGK